MRYSTITLLIFSIFLFYSCSSKKEETSLIKELDQQSELVSAYTEAMNSLKNDPYFAATKFLEAELLFPQSDWAPKSALYGVVFILSSRLLF